MENIVERVSKTANIPPELLSERPPFPKNAKIEVTSRCDLQCFFCSNTYKGADKGDINRDFLFRMLREMKDLGVQDVGLFWLGEPLLVTALPEYVAYAKEIGIEYVFITTNGRLATPERIKALFDSGLDSIKFSINAGNKERYLKICGVDAFDRVIENVRAAYEYRAGRKRPAIYASTVFDPDKRSDYDSVNSLIRCYVDQHYPLRLYGEYTFPEGEGEAPATPFVKSEEGRTLDSMLPCWSLFTEPHISYDGFMSACFCDHDKRLYMGNLNEVSLIEAWHSQKFIELRRFHLGKKTAGTVCESCVAYKK